MTTAVRWEREAQADREAIFRYLCQEAGLQVACAADDKFASMVNILQENPLAGIKAGSAEKQRKLVVPRFPFIVVYVAEDSCISILRVLHISRKIAGHYGRS
ncbi:type II toxin-antitoxin system RelE/ParE family toxin [Pluralibacter gergoviae]|uniref:type II toxin-antitoxin system RelE/ParE family toxin n=1 Tax=Pluralibacter gergoviae TaxID=61647 RepID=UPI000BFBBEE6|nr:type II toxin-antitoxin system RelE/ParE family toxin [Pluralibacter gergoviae]PHH45846.1 plasmid stabilization protein [Pluralibacter gergoviae]